MIIIMGYIKHFHISFSLVLNIYISSSKGLLHLFKNNIYTNYLSNTKFLMCFYMGNYFPPEVPLCSKVPVSKSHCCLFM